MTGALLKQGHRIWQYGLWSFQAGGTKLERFLPRNQHIQRKLLNFENWFSGEFTRFLRNLHCSFVLHRVLA